jgi:hypothetical protein
LEKIETVEAHKNKRINCFFIKGDKAVSIDLDGYELFYWDTKDIKNWKKIFSIEKKMSIIVDSNRNL